MALLLLLLVGVLLAVFRYLPALDEARALRAELQGVQLEVRKGLPSDLSSIASVERRLAAAREHLQSLEGLLADDPLIGLARLFQPTAANVRGADGVVSAARDLMDASRDGVSIGRRFVQIKEASAASGDQSVLPQLVELMATSRVETARAAATLDHARRTLAVVPNGLVGPVQAARDAVSTVLARYGPPMDELAAASVRLPAILGWNGPRKYLVLTQNPAELRPSGGFIGSYGLITFDRGRVTQRAFRDVFLLDLPWDYPFVKPPQALADYLLGPRQPWQLADANWSPDFPTAARDALRLYTNESGDSRVDGVLAITTYTIDEMLAATGPIRLPDYGATIESGQTTLKVLQLTRSAAEGGANRKAILSSLADALIDRLVAMTADQAATLIGKGGAFKDHGLLLAWFRDAEDQALSVSQGFDGAVRQDAGDFIYPVDSNVAPASKLSAVTTRRLELDVTIDGFGNARNALSVTWENGIETDAGRGYRELPLVGDLRLLGMYHRLLVPARSRLESVSGGSLVQVTAPAVVGDEAGRMAIGTYLKVPPGAASLHLSWVSPYAAVGDATGGVYRLTIQHQPGLLSGPLTVRIHVPIGLRILDVSPPLSVSGASATASAALVRDLVLSVRYGR